MLFSSSEEATVSAETVGKRVGKNVYLLKAVIFLVIFSIYSNALIQGLGIWKISPPPA